MDKERPAISEWAIQQREDRGWKPLDVIDALERVTGHPYAETTYRIFEAGSRPPSKRIAKALEKVYGGTAPDTKTAAPPEWAKRLAEDMERRFTARLEKWQRDQETAQKTIATVAARLERLARSRGGRSGKEDQETDG